MEAKKKVSNAVGKPVPVGPFTLRQRLILAMRDIGYLKKDGRNTSQKYSYLSERKVKEECQKAFIKYGLVPEWQMRIHHMGAREFNGKNGFDVIVEAELIIASNSEIQEMVHCTGLGQGRDPGDKAVMKAQTSAVRECLKNLFLIASGDDPEASEPDGDDTKAKRTAKPKTQLDKRAILDMVKRTDTIAKMNQLKMDMPGYVDHLSEADKQVIRREWEKVAAKLTAEEGK